MAREGLTEVISEVLSKQDEGQTRGRGWGYVSDLGDEVLRWNVVWHV